MSTTIRDGASGGRAPLVSVGVPVFNGENFLAEAIESLLAQTLEDFEVVISDNGSSDRTPEILGAFAAREPRIRLHRFPSNVGAAKNYNQVFHLARGKYFKWASHDDVCAPNFLRRCVDALEADPTLVVAYPGVTIIDAKGQRVGDYDEGKDLHDDNAYARFRRLVLSPGECSAVFGVIRSAVLARTRLIESFPASDRNLLAELSLLGRFTEVPERLLFRRDHPNTSGRAAKTSADVAAWFDPAACGRPVLSSWRAFGAYLRAVLRAPLCAKDRLACVSLVMRMAFWRRADLWHEAATASRMIVGRALISRTATTALRDRPPHNERR